MALHDSLRDLVAVRGAGVVDEAEELRGALDDFLAEDEATLGEMNLLVDAVRLGALRRALDVMAHGADPEAAVREAGAALARDRGTDDPTRSCWALAALCFALGKVDESLVRAFRADAGTVSAPGPPTAPHGRAPDPAAPGPATPVSHTGGIPATPVVDQPSTPVPPPPPPTADVRPAGTLGQRPAPVPPAIPERRASRAGTFLLVVLVALILGGLVAAGVILLRDGDDDPTATDDPSESASASEGPRKVRPLIPRSSMLVPYVEDDLSRIYQVDPATGDAEPVTPEGTDARLPTISPDRRTMTYQLGGAPSTTVIVDLANSGERALFSSGPCAISGRPAWSPDGSRLAVLCAAADGDEEPDGIWVADADGENLMGPVVEGEGLTGSPTWISDTELVYGQTDDATGEVSFLRVDAAGGEPEPLPIDLEGHLSHIDWSPEKRRLLLLVSPDATEVQGDVWTMNADGSEQVQLTSGGSYAHPVWSDDGEAIGVTLPDPSTGEEVLGYLPVADPANPVVVPDPPTDQVGVPVWGSR